MSNRREAGSVRIKLQSYSRFLLFIFLSKRKWLPLVSSFKRSFIWTYVRMVSCAANNSFPHSSIFWQLTLDVELFLKLAWIVKVILIEDETYLVSHSDNDLSGRRAVQRRSHNVCDIFYYFHNFKHWWLSCLWVFIPYLHCLNDLNAIMNWLG